MATYYLCQQAGNVTRHIRVTVVTHMRKAFYLLFIILTLNSCFENSQTKEYEFNIIDSDTEYLTETGKVNIRSNIFEYKPISQDESYSLVIDNEKIDFFNVKCTLIEKFTIKQFNEEIIELHNNMGIGFDTEQHIVISKNLGILGRRGRFGGVTIILNKIGEKELNAETKKLIFEKLK
jgi:hypothetical protein